MIGGAAGQFERCIAEKAKCERDLEVERAEALRVAADLTEQRDRAVCNGGLPTIEFSHHHILNSQGFTFFAVLCATRREIFAV